MFSTPATFCEPVNLLPSAAQAAGTATGTGIDRRGFENLLVTLSLGALGASGTVDVKLQEGDTLGGSYADITGAVFTQKTKAGSMDNLIYHGQVDLRGRKAFIRAISVVGAATCQVAVIGHLYNAQRDTLVTRTQPASNANVSAAPDFSV